MMIAMEVLQRVVPFASSSSSCAIPQCAIPQCASKSCPSSVPIVQQQAKKPSGFVASLVGSLIASVPPSLAANYTDTAQPVQSAAIDVAANANPTVLFAGVAAAVAVPLIAFQAYATPQSFGSVSPVAAFAALSEPNAQLLDIRAPDDARASGTPNLKSLRKKPVQVVYKPEDEAFVEKVVAKYRAETTTLYVLDGSDGNALVAAKLLANNGFQSAFAISGGVEGWQENELPWLEPWKGFNLNIDGLKNLFSGSDNSSLAPTTLGAAAAAGLAVAVFAEAETVLQLLGSAAFIQIFAKRFMFADDREKTLNEIQTFLDTKVAPKEFASELKEVGRILIPKEGEGNKAALARGNAVAKQKDLKVEDSSLTPEFKIADQGS